MASLYCNGGQLILRKHPATSELQYKPYAITLPMIIKGDDITTFKSVASS